MVLTFLSSTGAMVFFPPKFNFPFFRAPKRDSELIAGHPCVQRATRCLPEQESRACSPNLNFDESRSVVRTQIFMFTSHRKKKKENCTTTQGAIVRGAEYTVVLRKNFWNAGKSRFVVVHAMSSATRGWFALFPKNNTPDGNQVETYVFCTEFQDLSKDSSNFFVTSWANGFSPRQKYNLACFPHKTRSQSDSMLIV